VGDLTPPYLWSIAVMYCGVAAKTGQAEMPGREPCLLCLLLLLFKLFIGFDIKNTVYYITHD
jgi:hypothetical protein